MNKEVYQIPHAKLQEGELPVGIFALNPKDGKGRVLTCSKKDIQDDTVTANEFSLTPVQLSLVRILDEEEGIHIDSIIKKYEQAPALNLAMTIATTEHARRSSISKKKAKNKIESLLNENVKPMIGLKSTEAYPDTIRMQIMFLRKKISTEAVTALGKNTYRLTTMEEIPKLPVPETVTKPKLPFFQKLASDVQSFLSKKTQSLMTDKS